VTYVVFDCVPYIYWECHFCQFTTWELVELVNYSRLNLKPRALVLIKQDRLAIILNSLVLDKFIMNLYLLLLHPAQ
jgi:hypothetical protein